MTDTATARDEFFAAFLAAWAAGPNTPVAWQNTTDDTIPPADASPWIRVTLTHATGGQNALGGEDGSREFRNGGTVFVNVFVQEGTGTAAIDALVDAAYDALIGTVGGLILRDQRVNEAGPTDGGWFQVDVLADFIYDFVR